MAAKSLADMFQRLRALATLHEAGQFPDRELLARFIQDHDETAFTALVERHGAMVLTVCRRVLHHHQDAEDACQATFLILVRKASSIRKLNSLSSWLHGVALRVARKLRARRARLPRPVDEQTIAGTARTTEPGWSEVGSVLDEELQQLPEKYRAPLVLCYLQARTRDEAAQELGWKPGTLKGRLELGRKLLQKRLARRGLALSAALLGSGLGQGASAAVSAPLVVTIVRAALESAAGKTLSAGLVSAQAAWLAQDFVRGLFVRQLQVGAGVCLLGLVLAGAGVLAYPVLLPRAGDPVVAELPPAPVFDEPVPVVAPPQVPPPEAEKQPPQQAKEMTLLERGEHLFNQAARCADCHSPRGGRRENEASDLSRGGRAGKWSEDRLVRFLTSKEAAEGIAAHMMSAADARAVAAYVASLPPRKKGEDRRDDD